MFLGRELGPLERREGEANPAEEGRRRPIKERGCWTGAEDGWHAVGCEAREIRWGPTGKALDEDIRSSDAILCPVRSH